MQGEDLSLVIDIRDEGGTRRVDASDRPLTLGGPSADIHLPGVEGTEPVAFIGQSNEELFIQPGRGASVVCNGISLSTSRWLRDGDVIVIANSRLQVEIRDRHATFRFESEKSTPSPVPVGQALERPESVGTKIKPASFKPMPISQATRKRGPLRPGMILFWIVLLVLGTVGWYLFTARTVEIRVEPVPDRMEVAGGLGAVQVGGRYLLRPGNYALVAEKEGYIALETSLEVTEDHHQTFQFNLERAPGILEITTVPAGGLVVLVDGKEVGVTPIEPLELSPGLHHVRIRGGSYREFAAEVTMEGGGVVQTLSAELDVRWAAVTFNSQPSGASVRINGREVGSTPLTADILEGTHRYELYLAGHKPYRSRVVVVSGKPQKLDVIELAPVDGNLQLTSEPSGADVLVDGVYAGRTPVDLELSPGEAHELSLSVAGYEPALKEVRVDPGVSQMLHIELTGTFGAVEIVCDPPDAELLINGEARGRADQTVELTAVPQTILIRKPGYESYQTTLTPRPGFTQSVEVVLRTLEQAKVEDRPTVYTTEQGHELKLVEPRRFRMGASRREPGRRANETLREVELTRPYYISTQEVSNVQFRKFKAKHRSGQVQGHNLEVDHHPAVRVSWEDAARYCNWLSEQGSRPAAYEMRGGKLVAVHPPTSGYRLPTEAEWAGAARYPDGANGLKYPWGSSLPVAKSSGNYADVSAKGIVPVILTNYNDSFPVTAPVDSFGPNPLGLFNLGGNVAEWMHDYYTIYSSTSAEVARDPLGPKEGKYHVIRGSSWMHGTVTELRLSYRDYGDEPRPDVGFRIARYPE
jgi:formylglycine-generating enzyme required for sulfatase activity